MIENEQDIDTTQDAGVKTASALSESLSLTGRPVVFNRFWDMPSSDTFDVPSIRGFVQKYLMKSKVSIDPFARNKRWATYTNDLNADTAAECHMEALDFLEMLKQREVKHGELSCVIKKKYNEVLLCFRSGCNISFAEIKLHSGNRAEDADAVFEDAANLGYELVRRWNEAKDKR